jgi:hypothetical protein
MAAENENIQVLERGDIYFLYRPRVEEKSPEGLEDVQRSYIVLKPDERDRYRLIILGRKRLPQIEEGGEKNWAYVAMVRKDPKSVEKELREETYQTKTRGERHLPAARPAGEGRYAVARHGDHTHLVYALELPEKPGEVQRELDIEESGSYIISIKNPEKPSPPSAGLPRNAKAELPPYLIERFRDRRFAECDPPEFLDHEQVELMIIGAKEDPVKELGIELRTEKETERTAEIINDLKISKREHPLEPLFKGEWA